MAVKKVAAAACSMDLSLLISIVALVLSVLSPVISSIISGLFHYNEKKLELKSESERRNHEFYEQHRAEVIERYINAAGKASKSFSDGNLQEFGASMGEIYMYVDQSLWPLLDSIASKIDKDRSGDPTAELRVLCQKLSTYNIRPPQKEIQKPSFFHKPKSINK